MILRDRCGTSYDLASLFRARHSALDTWSGKNAKRNEAVSFALGCPFLKEVSQNCLVFDVVNFKNGGCLAECLRFEAVNFHFFEDVLSDCFVSDR